MAEFVDKTYTYSAADIDTKGAAERSHTQNIPVQEIKVRLVVCA